MNKSVIFIIAIFALMLFTCASLYSQKQPQESGLEFENLKTYTSRITYRGRIVDETGHYRYRYNEKAAGYTGSSEEIARQYLREHNREFGIDKPEETLRVLKTSSTPGGAHVLFNQVISGIPVYASRVVVTLNRKEEVTFIANEYRHNISMNTIRPGIASVDAVQIAKTYLKINGDLLGKESSELVLFESADNGARLSWMVSIPATEPHGDWEVIVDAVTGEILQVKDRMMYINGHGMIWDPDPLTNANVLYGGAYTDNSDTDSEALNSQRIDVVLKDITFENGSYKLKGPFAVLADLERPYETFPEPADSNAFSFTRTEQGFEAVLCYYFVDLAGRRLVELGYDVPEQREFQVDPHGLRGQDNSQYVPSLNYIAFGEGGVDDAEDSDAILHEYAHSFQTNLTGGMSSSGETLSLQEGCSDYWTASYSRATNDYNWGYVFNWDGHNEFWDGRRCDLNWVYPQDYVSGHDGGQIWSSALMKIWSDLGRDITDKLFLETHYIWGYSPSLQDAAQALIQADRNLYEGAHLSVITEHFIFHGLAESGEYLPSIEHIPLTDTHDTKSSYAVVARILPGPEPLDMQKIRMIYGISDFSDTLLMQPTSTPDEYQADIPPSGNDVDIYYYIIAADSASAAAYHPYSAPYDFHRFHVEAIGSITGHVDLTDNFDDSGVQVILSGIKNDTVFTGTDGIFSFFGLEDSVYTVKVFKLGYVTPDSIISGITVNQDTISGIDFILEPVISELAAERGPIPGKCTLEQNYPNPFNPITRIRFGLPSAGRVKLDVYNSAGQHIAALAESPYEAGYYTVEFNATHLSSGVYFYRLEVTNTAHNHFIDRQKMILIK